MKHSNWHMIVYDIADEKRLRKVHRILAKEGLPVQQSVFFFSGSSNNVNSILDSIASEMSLKDDDLRAYPVSHPGNVWTTTGGVLESSPLVAANESFLDKSKNKQKKSKRKNNKKSKQKSDKKTWFTRLTSIFKKN